MRVLLVEGQARVRRALHFFLKAQPGLLIVGETADVSSLLSQIEATIPDVVLLDWELPDNKPTALLTTLRQANPTLWVISLSSHPDSRNMALAAGADGFVCKGDPPEVLLAALQDVRSTGSNTASTTPV